MVTLYISFRDQSRVQTQVVNHYNQVLYYVNKSVQAVIARSAQLSRQVEAVLSQPMRARLTNNRPITAAHSFKHTNIRSKRQLGHLGSRGHPDSNSF